MSRQLATVKLTGRQADALHELLSIVLNDPDDAIVSDAIRPALHQVSSKVMAAMKAAIA